MIWFAPIENLKYHLLIRIIDNDLKCAHIYDFIRKPIIQSMPWILSDYLLPEKKKSVTKGEI